MRSLAVLAVCFVVVLCEGRGHIPADSRGPELDAPQNSGIEQRPPILPSPDSKLNRAFKSPNAQFGLGLGFNGASSFSYPNQPAYNAGYNNPVYNSYEYNHPGYNNNGYANTGYANAGYNNAIYSNPSGYYSRPATAYSNNPTLINNPGSFGLPNPDASSSNAQSSSLSFGGYAGIGSNSHSSASSSTAGSYGGYYRYGY